MEQKSCRPQKVEKIYVWTHRDIEVEGKDGGIHIFILEGGNRRYERLSAIKVDNYLKSDDFLQSIEKTGDSI